jgi:uncharacterized protein (DUF1778 family)
MARLTLRLPESLHRQLKEQASIEGISLNQYIVYSLTRQATSAEARFTALRQSLRKGSDEEIEEALANREVVEPEPGLTADMVERLRQRIEAAKQVADA